MSQPVPEPGFYYHYKHDPNGDFTNYAYEILGLSRHTEDKSYLVRYRPLYENTYLGEAEDSVRPLSMWFDEIEKDGEKVSRFTRITEPELVARFMDIRAKMYGT